MGAVTVPKRLKQLWKERTGRDDLDQMTDFLRLRGFANCWHVNSHESVAMWNQYARGENTLVLRSTVGKLCDALANAPKPFMSAKLNMTKYVPTRSTSD